MKSTRFVSSLFRFAVAAITLGSVAINLVSQADAQTRIEIRAFETTTLTTQQFLTGDTAGKPAVLAGELRIPRPGTDRLPAVILIHGSGGLGSTHDRWVSELNDAGLATFVVDSFSGRGINNTVDDQSQLASLAMMVDAYRALAALAQHPRIDANRIAVMGFSKGAVAAIYSSNERFRKMYGAPNLQFAAHIGLYTPCNVTLKNDDKVSGKPIRLFHGAADDWVSIEPCRDYAARLKRTGADVTLTEFSDAYHAYDAFMLKEPRKLPQAQTTRHCLLAEGESGEIFNSKSGKHFDLNDPCVERGTTVAYNEEATRGTTQAVKELLAGTTIGALKKN
jgi:dienelactone hydrolase